MCEHGTVLEMTLASTHIEGCYYDDPSVGSFIISDLQTAWREQLFFLLKIFALNGQTGVVSLY